MNNHMLAGFLDYQDRQIAALEERVACDERYLLSHMARIRRNIVIRCGQPWFGAFMDGYTEYDDEVFTDIRDMLATIEDMRGM